MKKQSVIVFAVLIGLSVFTGCSKKESANAQIVTFISEQQFIDDYFETLNTQ